MRTPHDSIDDTGQEDEQNDNSDNGKMSTATTSSGNRSNDDEHNGIGKRNRKAKLQKFVAERPEEKTTPATSISVKKPQAQEVSNDKRHPCLSRSLPLFRGSASRDETHIALPWLTSRGLQELLELGAGQDRLRLLQRFDLHGRRRRTGRRLTEDMLLAHSTRHTPTDAGREAVVITSCSSASLALSGERLLI